MRHPMGARSIGIGHPRSGDRCANTRLNSLDPLRVAEQIFPYRRPLWASHSPGKLDSATPCRGASITTLHNELNDLCKAQMRQPSRACIA